MKRITIKITTENVAFVPHPELEIARILRELATRFEDQIGNPPTLVRDVNGNQVGKVKVEEGDSE